MKNILLLVHDDDGQEARLQAALDVTRAVNGHLTCLDVTMLPVMAGDYWVGAGTAMLLEDERVREAVNREKIEARIGHEGVAWTWIDATGDLAICIERASVLTDLIVVNRRIDGFPVPDMRNLAAELILKSGKPILAIPSTADHFTVAGRVLVAWNGSHEADAALRAAVPLLGLATHVTIFEVDDGSVKVPAEHAAAYLSRHGIHALVVRQENQAVVAEDLILEAIRQRQIDYVVMGGFGHSRFREALCGGVSRKMLTASPVPVLLAH